MATSFKAPRTGIFYFQRVVPVALRPFFDGGSSEYKRTLDTRDPEEARQRYHPHAVVYEQKLAAARRALASQQLRSARAMVDDFLAGQSDEELQGVPQKLATLEFGAFQYANGLTDDATGDRHALRGAADRLLQRDKLGNGGQRRLLRSLWSGPKSVAYPPPGC